MKKWMVCYLVLMLATTAVPAFAEDTGALDYTDSLNWAYYEAEGTDKGADVFFIAPTVYGGKEDAYNMPVDSTKYRDSFIGATNMEKGIYDDDARFFAPFYRQIGLTAYLLDAEAWQEYAEIAFRDVKAAFEFYMANENQGRPLVLAGFSQGAEMAIRLVKDCFSSPERQELLVACYAIGWRVTDEDIQAYPHLRPAEGETDTGVIVSFNSEAESITDSLMIPQGTKTHAINPLNWQTDHTPAEKELNLGACFTNYDGEITREIPGLTGAYIDDIRGALKVTDVTPEEYPASLSLFEEGVYHIYDYQFFYRNLEENVQKRIDSVYAEVLENEAA